MVEYCPTRGGSFTAYLPQYLHAAAWINIPICKGRENGIPYPEFERGVLEAIDLCGYAQAMALAWCWAAVEAAEGRPILQVRAQAYKVHYDIKALAVEEERVLSDNV